ncbi:MAG: outer membrane lipoprotein carrier protein LolA [Bacteroidales bacterium]|jgi:outer membrane lipoprotein-sorting protein|nr:outer membrane lipoprotein carrier protein LolA [Bacteroidales bacterium]
MMRVLNVFALLMFLPALASAQKDDDAVNILDRFSQKALSAPSVSMTFDLETTDQVEGTNSKVSGSAILSKDKYMIELPDNIMWYNGETSWNYLIAEKEVTISAPEKKDDTFYSKPSAVFSIYKKDYKVRLLEERNSSYLIDLYPENIESDHIRIRLVIGKPELDLRSVEYKYKNGITLMLRVREYSLKKVPEASEFAYPANRYKGVEVIDMR